MSNLSCRLVPIWGAILALTAVATFRPALADPVPSPTPIPYLNLPPDASRFFESTARLHSRGEYQQMLLLAQGWEAAHPESPDGYLEAGRADYYMGDYQAAIQAGEKVLQLNPQYKLAVSGWLGQSRSIDQRFPNLHLQPVELSISNADVPAAKLRGQAQTLLKAKQYEEIEKVAARLLASRAELPNGEWQYALFCKGLWYPGQEQDAEARWKAQLAQIQEWRRARPKSHLATIALARAWTDGAWLARGNGYADTITEEGGRNMEYRISQAYPLYRQMQADLTKTPLVFLGLHSTLMLMDIDRDSYNMVWNRTSKAFPGFLPLYYSKTNYLMPRWYGQPGEWEAFAANSANALGGERGDILYARLMIYQFPYYRTTFWQQNNVSWPRTKRGLTALLKQSRDPVTDATSAFVLAVTQHDYAFARQLVAGPLSHYVSSERYTIPEFAIARNFVLMQEK